MEARDHNKQRIYSLTLGQCSVQTTNGENGHVSLVLVLNLLVGIEFTTNFDDSGSLLLLVLANQGRVRRTTASIESLFS